MVCIFHQQTSQTSHLAPQGIFYPLLQGMRWDTTPLHGHILAILDSSDRMENLTACMDMEGYESRNTTRNALEIKDEKRANLIDLTIIEREKNKYV